MTQQKQDPRNEKAYALLKRGDVTMRDIIEAVYGEWPLKGLDIDPGIRHDQIVSLRGMNESTFAAEHISKNYEEREARRFKVASKLQQSFNDASHAIQRHVPGLLGRALANVFKLAPQPVVNIVGGLQEARNQILSQFAGSYKAIDNLEGGVYMQSADRMIFINRIKHGRDSLRGLLRKILKIKPESSLIDTVAHEGAHVLQGDHHYRAADTLGKDNHKIILDLYSKEPANMEMMMFNDDEQKRASSYKPLEYYAEGIELQARIHELMSDGYGRWGRMPATQDEFLAALQDCGVINEKERNDLLPRVPANIAKGDVAPFLTDTKQRLGAAYDISGVIDTIVSNQGKIDFTLTVLPMLYCDLIEMLGDRQGRARMGFAPDFEKPKSQMILEGEALRRNAVPTAETPKA